MCDERSVKITDLGIAFVVKDSMTRLTSVDAAGTIHYLAPEQLQGKKATAKSDQYSFAATVYELLSGDPPFHGAAVSYQIINGEVVKLDCVSDVVNNALLRALDKDPDKRFNSCRDFYKALRGKKVAPPVVLEKVGSYVEDKQIEVEEESLDLKANSLAHISSETDGKDTVPVEIINSGQNGVQKTNNVAIVGVIVVVLFFIAGLTIVGGLYVSKQPSTLVGPSIDRVPVDPISPAIPTTPSVNIPTFSPIQPTVIAATQAPAVVQPTVIAATQSPVVQPTVSPPIAVPLVTKRVVVSSKPKVIKKRKTTFVNSIGMKFVWIKSGGFTMGTARGGRSNERPTRYVKVNKGFWIASKETTNDMYKKVMGKLPSAVSFSGANSNSINSGSKYPVTKVSFDDALKFCRAMSEIDKKAKAFPGDTVKTYGLPTEAQWEYAARGGSSSLTSVSGFNSLNSGRKSTYEVGHYPANGFGLYDMVGNVWEWVLDPWHSTYNGAPSNSLVWDYSGNSDYRVIRGGSFDIPATQCRYGVRLFEVPYGKRNDIGFRVILPVP